MTNFQRGILIGVVATAIVCYLIFFNDRPITELEKGISIGAGVVLFVFAWKRANKLVNDKFSNLHERITECETDLGIRVRELEYKTKIKKKPKHDW
jgi:hypothetical protein